MGTIQLAERMQQGQHLGVGHGGLGRGFAQQLRAGQLFGSVAVLAVFGGGLLGRRGRIEGLQDEVVSQGLRDYGRSRVIKRTDPRGFDYYWFALGHILHTPAHSTDLEAIEDGFITVTPLHLDLTFAPALDVLAERYRANT